MSARVDYRTLPVGTEYRDPSGNVIVKRSSGTDHHTDPYMVTPAGRHAPYGITERAYPTIEGIEVQ